MKRTDSIRSQRLADQIMRELAEILARDMSDPRLEGLSISGVRLNPNLRVAEVLYTLAPDPARRKNAAKCLAQAGGRLRALLGERLEMRQMPELRFVLDSFLEDVVYAGPSGDSAPDLQDH